MTESRVDASRSVDTSSLHIGRCFKWLTGHDPDRSILSAITVINEPAKSPAEPIQKGDQRQAIRP